jgi:TorA maturation chaperone TorD
MEQHYRRHGVQRAASFHDLPDHVALQLEFVAYLFADAHGAPDACEAARREAAAYEFLAEFVAAWAPAFSASFARAARTPGLASPYPALAEILRSAVAHDTADRHAHALSPDPHPPRTGPAGPTVEQLAEIAAERRPQEERIYERTEGGTPA